MSIEAFRRKLVRRRWSWTVGLYKGATLWDLREAQGVANPIFTAKQVTDIDARFVADPFLHRRNGRWYLFMEIQPVGETPAVIGVAESANLVEWRYLGVALTEQFHLSFPYVFAGEESVWMIPEMAQAERLQIYESLDFPWRWSATQTVAEGQYRDPACFFHMGSWWIIASESVDLAQRLAIFRSDTIRGNWRRQSVGHDLADSYALRAAGRVLQTGERVLRPVQDGRKPYGTAVLLAEITELSSVSYRQSLVSDSPVVGSSGMKWNSRGMHTLDAHQLADGSWIAAVDGLRWQWSRGSALDPPWSRLRPVVDMRGSNWSWRNNDARER